MLADKYEVKNYLLMELQKSLTEYIAKHFEEAVHYLDRMDKLLLSPTFHAIHSACLEKLLSRASNFDAVGANFRALVKTLPFGVFKQLLKSNIKVNNENTGNMFTSANAYMFQVWAYLLEWRNVKDPSVEMLQELYKLVKFPLMTVGFLVAEVLPFISKYTPDYHQLVLESINYQNLLKVFSTLEQSNERVLMKKQILLMQSAMCKDKLIDYSAFEPRQKSNHGVYFNNLDLF
jgi:hypothetical protein